MLHLSLGPSLAAGAGLVVGGVSINRAKILPIPHLLAQIVRYITDVYAG